MANCRAIYDKKMVSCTSADRMPIFNNWLNNGWITWHMYFRIIRVYKKGIYVEMREDKSIYFEF